jgi:hypothetical protein
VQQLSPPTITHHNHVKALWWLFVKTCPQHTLPEEIVDSVVISEKHTSSVSGCDLHYSFQPRLRNFCVSSVPPSWVVSKVCCQTYNPQLYIHFLRLVLATCPLSHSGEYKLFVLDYFYSAELDKTLKLSKKVHQTYGQYHQCQNSHLQRSWGQTTYSHQLCSYWSHWILSYFLPIF